MPKVIDVYSCPGVAPENVVEAAAIAERCSEHPLGKAILQKAVEMSLASSEPERFEYVPGKGIVCSLNGDRVIVGSRAFLRSSNWTLARLRLIAATPLRCWWRVVVVCSGQFRLQMRCGQSRSRQSRRCEKWACAQFF